MDSECLTNEALLKHFPNQFKLALYAIDLARDEIHRGQETEDYLESQNVATLVLGHISEGVDAIMLKKSHERDAQQVKVETKVKAVV